MFHTCLIVFILGAILGTIGDSFHVLSSTDGYLNPIAPIPGTNQPFWVPLLFGTATLTIGIDSFLTSKIFKRRHLPFFNWKRCVGGVLAFLAIYWASGFLPLNTGGTKDIVLALGALTLWVALDRSLFGLTLSLKTALIGTAFEIMLTHFGAFYYFPAHANFFGVPSWLPWLYIAASVAVGNTFIFLTQRPVKQG